MTQTTFFDAPRRDPIPLPHFVRSSGTSRESALQLAPSANRLQERVFEFIRRRGQFGAIDEEIAEGLEMLSDTARARRCELRDEGRIEDSGRHRPTRRGRAAVVWVISREIDATSVDREVSAPSKTIAEARLLAEAVPGVRCADAISREMKV